MFKNRQDAGQQLGQALKKYRNKKGLVLGIPRGGVEIGLEVAKILKADLDILVSRKLGYPTNPEAGFGAVAEDGSLYLTPQASLLAETEIESIIKQQKQEAARRVQVFRNNRPLPPMADRIVIVVDDGIAVGVTIKAALKLCRQRQAKKIIAAAPVSGPEMPAELKSEADEVVILQTPLNFQAVAQAYQNWHDVTDEEVLALMKTWQNQPL